MSAHFLALLAMVGAPAVVRPSVADAAARALRSVAAQDRVSEEIIAAIIEHESHGRTEVCREDRGGSSRGLMQIWHPDSKCDMENDLRFASDYDPAKNVWAGVRLLAKQHVYHLSHCKYPHDVLTHYAGSGPLAKRFARDIRRRARELQRPEKENHGRR